jgi:hypothetical protein
MVARRSPSLLLATTSSNGRSQLLMRCAAVKCLTSYCRSGNRQRPFPISDNGLRVTLDAAGFSRYDGFSQWVGGLDTTALVSLLNDYEMIATQALTRMGVSDFDIRSAVLAATTQILSTPQVAVDAELMRREANWVYMDPELEALSSLQKQVLRMGPENADIVQQKARDIRGVPAGREPLAQREPVNNRLIRACVEQVYKVVR